MPKHQNGDPLFIEDLKASQDSLLQLDSKIEDIEFNERRARPKADNFNQFFVQSTILHASIIVFALLFSVVKNLLISPEEQEALLRAKEMKTAIRVDVVDLPKLKQEQMQDIDMSKPVGVDSELPDKAQPIVEDKQETKELPPPPAPSKTAMLDKTQKAKDESSAKNKKSESRLEELRKSMRVEARRQALAKKLEGETRPELGGNIVSEGYATTGDVATEGEAYVGKTTMHMKRYWNIPAWMQASKLKAKVLIRIAPDGRLLKYEFVKKSGNASYDQEVERAIAASNPLPAPPATLRREVMERGILCEF